MTITQTIDIPADRRITLEVPKETPIGRASVEYKVIPFGSQQEKLKTSSERDKELFEKYADELNAEAEDVLSYQNMYLDKMEK